MEELVGERTHVDIMLQVHRGSRITREQADRADPAPGTLAAIESSVLLQNALAEGVRSSRTRAMPADLEGAPHGYSKSRRSTYLQRAGATYELHASRTPVTASVRSAIIHKSRAMRSSSRRSARGPTWL